MGDGIDGGTGGSLDILPLLSSMKEAEARGDVASAAADLALLDMLTNGEEMEEK